jgi:hypothetical protein
MRHTLNAKGKRREERGRHSPQRLILLVPQQYLHLRIATIDGEGVHEGAK